MSRDAELVRGLRRAMAEIVALRVEAEARIEPRASANRDRRAQVRAYSVAYNRLNRLLYDLLPAPGRAGTDIKEG